MGALQAELELMGLEPFGRRRQLLLCRRLAMFRVMSKVQGVAVAPLPQLLALAAFPRNIRQVRRFWMEPQNDKVVLQEDVGGTNKS